MHMHVSSLSNNGTMENDPQMMYGYILFHLPHTVTATSSRTPLNAYFAYAYAYDYAYAYAYA